MAESAPNAARGAEVLITMLSDADAVADAVDSSQGALAAMDASGVWIQMSTIGLAGTERCSTLAEDRGVAFVDSPVLGTKEPAENGELIVLASCPEDPRAAGVWGAVHATERTGPPICAQVHRPPRRETRAR